MKFKINPLKLIHLANSKFRIIIRALIIIAISIYCLKYRNDNCIANQDCKPFFLSYELSPYKDFKQLKVINYKIENNMSNIDFIIDRNFNKINERALVNLSQKEREDILKVFTNKIYNDTDLINNNLMLIKKFQISNNSPNTVKVKTNFNLTPEHSGIVIYNCLCNSNLTLKPYERKDLYLYLNYKMMGFYLHLNQEELDKIVLPSEIRISVF